MAFRDDWAMNTPRALLRQGQPAATAAGDARAVAHLDRGASPTYSRGLYVVRSKRCWWPVSRSAWTRAPGTNRGRSNSSETRAARVLCFDELAVRLHAHQDAETDEQTHQRSATKGNQRQRNADDRKNAAGAESDRRLRAVISRSQRIARRVEKGQYSFLLIIVQVRPDQRRCRGGGGQKAEHDLPRQTRKVEHVKPGSADHQRGTQIGLAFDQPDRQSDEHHREDEIAEANARLVLLKIPGKHQRKCDLHQLGRLKAGKAEIEPAARSIDHGSAKRHRDQQ